MQKPSVSAASIVRYKHQQWLEDTDLVSVEEPLEIRIVAHSNDNIVERPIAVTMRTPGHDVELALGFLITEGIIPSTASVKHVRHCTRTKSAAELGNVIIVTMQDDVILDLDSVVRNFYTTSSCGVCGKESIDAIKSLAHCPVNHKYGEVPSDIILSLPDRLGDAQRNFKHTGGIHAVAVFDLQGHLVITREDVGRHNAMDKVAGAIASADTMSNNDYIALLSGRASFELIQKAAMMSLLMVCAIGAPSSLAIDTARAFDISLVGFLRDDRYNIYHQGRIRII